MSFKNFQRKFVNGVLRLAIRPLFRINTNELDKIPAEGPLLIYPNHIGSMEVPLIYSLLQPRPVSAMAKAESWDSRFYAWLFDLWRLVPVKRGEADINAIRRSIEIIRDGYIFTISPEGTRSGDGKLQQAHPGIVPIALKTGTPLQPIAHFGIEDLSQNLKKLRRTNFNIRVGKPFTLDPGGERVNSAVRQEMVDEMMIELAKLLPEEYRGFYADKVDKELKYIRYH